jgi:hypothetical protein
MRRIGGGAKGKIHRKADEAEDALLLDVLSDCCSVCE